ncbi:unnamed protein product [Ilex paraguariensis]|uniref:Dolichyl-diphosphooligosaccharide--protein glycosyltransferase subunit 3B n=1 Tax=Ilex paraguariensis TaxID=185542 RepID=A0ABC8RRQ1_9AQUA
MAIYARSTTTHLFLFITLLSLTIPVKPFSSSDPESILSELLTRQSQSQSGVIHLTDHLLPHILSPKTPRSFSLIIFFDAQQLHSKTDLHLPSLKSEFSLVASSFITNNKDNPDHKKLFFCDVEFKESQNTFAQFGVNALPHIRLIPPTAQNLKQDSIQMDAGDFSRLAESMAEFVESKTKLVLGPIHRPPLISTAQLMFIVAAIVTSLPFFAKKVIAGETLLHDWKLWLSGAVFVYFFSVAGTMHNIIRKMPMFMADRNDPSKLIFFYQGSGMQLGAEGLAVGSLYTIVGLMLAVMTHGLVGVRNRTVQRVMMIVALLVSFWAVRKVVVLDNWKTGYGIHAYWPSSW